MMKKQKRKAKISSLKCIIFLQVGGHHGSHFIEKIIPFFFLGN